MQYGKFDKDGVLTQLTIDRSKWARGGGPSALLTSSGKMCCIGFLCSALGYSNRRLLKKSFVSSLYNAADEKERDILIEMRLIDKHKSPILGMCTASPTWIGDAYAVNDNLAIPEKERESWLKKIFAGVGVKLKFVDGEG